jgi:hypothetical protein
MKEQNGVVDVTGMVAVRLAKGEVVEMESGDGLPVFEVEVSDVEGAIFGGPW